KIFWNGGSRYGTRLEVSFSFPPLISCRSLRLLLQHRIHPSSLGSSAGDGPARVLPHGCAVAQRLEAAVPERVRVLALGEG
ncbi:unnamed protein product, partial [Urochloa humidicola]